MQKALSAHEIAIFQAKNILNTLRNTVFGYLLSFFISYSMVIIAQNSTIHKNDFIKARSYMPDYNSTDST